MTQGEAIDLMDDARNNPALENQADGASAPKNGAGSQLSPRAAFIEMLRQYGGEEYDSGWYPPDSPRSGHARVVANEIRKNLVGTIDALYSRLAELEKVAVVAAEAIRTLDTYADDVRADWSDFDGRANRRELHAIVADLREQLRASSEGARAQ